MSINLESYNQIYETTKEDRRVFMPYNLFLFDKEVITLYFSHL